MVMSGLIPLMSATVFDTLLVRLKQEAHYWWHEGVVWYGRRSDVEQLAVACVFILLLLLLIICMSMRGKDPGSTGRKFGG